MTKTRLLRAFLTLTWRGGASVGQMADVEVVREEDPRAGELLASGWRVVGRSWGARLRLDDDFDPASYRARIATVEASGYRIVELDARWADALYRLESVTTADYPVTPATPAPEVTREATAALWEQGWRVFGAVRDGELVGATLIRQEGQRADTERTSVAATHRGRGVAGALKAASIISLAVAGARVFTTGGAAANAASLAMNRAAGYEITEIWLSLAPPPA